MDYDLKIYRMVTVVEETYHILIEKDDFWQILDVSKRQAEKVAFITGTEIRVVNKNEKK